MECEKSDCIHNKVCKEWQSMGNDNYINDSHGNCDCYEKGKVTIMDKIISVTHPNGFSGKLYGESSMSIFDKDGNEVLHTGFRNADINSEKALYEHLESFPEFLSMLTGEK